MMTVTENKNGRTYEFELPEIEYTHFSKFIKKASARINGFSASVGDKYDKLFTHLYRDMDGNVKHVNVWHTVYNVNMFIPDINNWELLVTYKNGNQYVADMTKKLKFSNHNHGIAYRKCDVCGHWIKNSSVIRNKVRGEELQVGSECLKSFGINTIKLIAEITAELTRIYDNYCTIDDEGTNIWEGTEDPGSHASVVVSDLIKAAKYHYNIDKEWKRGYYDHGMYVPSASSQAIQNNLLNKMFDGDDEYVNSVIEYAKAQPINSDFGEALNRVANSYYCKKSEAVYAFFMVKNYEDSKYISPVKLEAGMQVKVTGKVTNMDFKDTPFGTYCTYTILTPKGMTVVRNGRIPLFGKDGEETTEFYAMVKYVSKKVYLDRACKNPKKGIPVIEL